MKQALIGFVGVLLVTLLGWLAAFGATAPCDAMHAEAKKLGQAKDAKSRGIAEALGGAKSISQTECFAMAVRMKAFGAEGVTVVGPGAPAR